MKIACVTSLDSPAASVAGPYGSQGQSRSHETEVVVIGSGLGGLCCAAMLATYGVKVISALEEQHCAAPVKIGQRRFHVKESAAFASSHMLSSGGGVSSCCREMLI